jgi:hypothetical protein
MTPEAKFVHDLRNQLAIILGYCDLLLDTIPSGDPRRDDVVEIRTAAAAAIALLPRAGERPL